MLKLKLQYFGHLMPKIWLIGKDPEAGKDWGQEKRMTEDEVDMSLSKLLEMVKDREIWHTAVCGVTKSSMT